MSAPPGALLARASQAVREADLARRHGRVEQPDRPDHRGHRPAGRGRRGVPRRRRTATAPPVSAEVVGFRGGRTLLMPLGELQRDRAGHAGARDRRAVPRRGRRRAARPRDRRSRQPDRRHGRARRRAELRARRSPPPPDAFTRPRISERVGLGVRALDALVPCGRGQRLGIFAGSGVGKSSLLGMIARSTTRRRERDRARRRARPRGARVHRARPRRRARALGRRRRDLRPAGARPDQGRVHGDRDRRALPRPGRTT